MIDFESTFKIPTPLIRLHDDLFDQKKVRVMIKRDDLTHPELSGNKFRKLKYNLLHAAEQGQKKLLTFGGAFSNHLAAFAFACKHFGFDGLAIVRGEELNPDSNPTLSHAKALGMKMEFVDRETYRDKDKIAEKYKGEYVIIPEGGSNHLALKGVGEVIGEVGDHDYLVTAMGTGGTFAGLAKYSKQKVIGIPVLKNGDFLKNDLANLLGGEFPANGEIFTQYNFGGYAKFDATLINFLQHFEKTHQITIEQVYTAKAFYAFYDLLEKDFFPIGSTIVLLHTGGLQGRLAYL